MMSTLLHRFQRRDVHSMARIRSLLPGTQNVSVHKTEVDCTFQEVRSDEGGTLVHLSTFGSDDRQSGPKSSQTLQLDEKMARELIEVLIEVFKLD
jgi:ribosomal protein L18